jgi:hypothetical protein
MKKFFPPVFLFESKFFHNVAEILVSEGVKIRIVRSKQYYLDPTLHNIYQNKSKAIEERDFDAAAKYRKRENELLLEKGRNEMTVLRTEPEVSFFEYYDHSFWGYLSKERIKDRLIVNLIQAYNLDETEA